MNLTHATLRPILCYIFFGSSTHENIRYIVPKQGNWLNPQEDIKCSTYIAYAIREGDSKLAPRQYDMKLNGVPVTNNVITMQSSIELQFVGSQAEEFALSVLHWDSRADVHRALTHVGAQLMCCKRKVVAVPYFQDGSNSTLSFNVNVPIIWANVHAITEQPLNFAQLDGDVTIV